MIREFIYNGISPSEFGSKVCYFDAESDRTGVVMTYNTAFQNSTKRHLATSVDFTERLEIPFSIIKDPCSDINNNVYSVDEQRDILKWLTPRTKKRLEVTDEEGVGLYYVGYFNVSKILAGDDVIGFNLTFYNDSQFAYYDTDNEAAITNSGILSVLVDDDVEGLVYPIYEIKASKNGNISFYSEEEPSRVCTINGCVKDEIITIDSANKTITSDLISRNFENNFNFIFPRLVNNFENEYKDIKVTGSCTFKATVRNRRKVGVL